METKNDNLNFFISEIVKNSNFDKQICHFKNMPNLINLFRGLTAYKNIMKLDSIIIPKVSVNTNTCKMNISININSITDLKTLMECFKRHCSQKVSITNNFNNITIKM